MILCNITFHNFQGKENQMQDFDFRTIGSIIKQERKKAGITREKLSEIINISPRYLIAIENDGQAPSFQIFCSLIRIFNISIDQYLLPESSSAKSNARLKLDALLNQLDENDLIIVEATVEGIIRSKSERCEGDQYIQYSSC